MKSKHIWMLVGAAALIGGGIFLYNKNKKSKAAPKTAATSAKPEEAKADSATVATEKSETK